MFLQQEYIFTYETTDNHDDHGIHTRIVSTVLLRDGQSTSLFYPHLLQLSSLLLNVSAHWRQTYFRPNKPLPTNVGSNHSRLPIALHQPFKWVMVDFLVSCRFLGIPYIFYERNRLSSRIDEESGLRSYACRTCLVVRPITSFISLLKANRPSLSFKNR
jgi:hypothetical protein